MLGIKHTQVYGMTQHSTHTHIYIHIHMRGNVFMCVILTLPNLYPSSPSNCKMCQIWKCTKPTLTPQSGSVRVCVCDLHIIVLVVIVVIVVVILFLITLQYV